MLTYSIPLLIFIINQLQSLINRKRVLLDLQQNALNPILPSLMAT